MINQLYLTKFDIQCFGRANIYLDVRPGKAEIATSLKWYVDILLDKKDEAPKALIFCRSVG